ncbi:MFS transporter [Streptomyces tateyamensis]|uniref:MFS transporter n=1 Tax=Streptomyces tateyamensis TaxID=565073 RepID=A0A2V4NN26_9ACTN|nr:MFS transporter [Streptomyces tateyamensis]PYC82178.1 MFS transporter [Streptomyces tateyamensis]
MRTDRRWLLDPAPLRADRGFARFWATSLVTALAGQLTAVAVPLQLYGLTHDSTWVGAAALAGLAPMVLGALWGGALADAADRRRLLLRGSAGLAAVSALLAAQAAPAPGPGVCALAVLLALVTVQQALFGMVSGVRGAVVPCLVAADRLPAANALMALAGWSGGIGGPLLAGVLAATVGLTPLYLLDALALTAALLPLRGLPRLPAPAGGPAQAGLRAIGAGLRTLTGHQVLRTAYLADAVAMVFGMPAALFPQLAQERFGPASIGVLSAAMAGGVVAGNLLSGPAARVRRYGVAITVAVCGWGFAVAGFGLAGRLWVAAGWLALSGLALAGLSLFRKTLMQRAAPDAMRGRLQGADTVIAAGGPRLAGLLHGLAGAAWGTGWAITGGGILVILTMLATARGFRPTPP